MLSVAYGLSVTRRPCKACLAHTAPISLVFTCDLIVKLAAHVREVNFGSSSPTRTPCVITGYLRPCHSPRTPPPTPRRAHSYTIHGQNTLNCRVRLHPRLSSPPSIQKKPSWGSTCQFPHHLDRRTSRKPFKHPLITSSELPHRLYRKRRRPSSGSQQTSATYTTIFSTTYTEDGLVGKLGSTSSPQCLCVYSRVGASYVGRPICVCAVSAPLRRVNPYTEEGADRPGYWR